MGGGVEGGGKTYRLQGFCFKLQIVIYFYLLKLEGDIFSKRQIIGFW